MFRKRAISFAEEGDHRGPSRRSDARRHRPRLVPPADLCVAVAAVLAVAYGLSLAGGRVRDSRDQIAAHTAHVDSVAVSSDGRVVASASRDGRLRVWHLDTHRPISPAMELSTGFTRVAYAPRGDAMIAGGFAGELILVESGMERVLQQSSPSGAPVRSLAFAPDGAMLAAASDDGIVRVWDVATGRMSGALDHRVRRADRPDLPSRSPHPIVFPGVAFSSDGRTLVTIESGGQIAIWDIARARIRKQFSARRGSILAVAFAPDGRSIALGGSEGLALLDVEEGRCRDCPGGTGLVRSIVYLPDGKRLIVARYDRVDLWDVSGEVVHLRRLDDRGNRVRSLAICPDGATLVVGTYDGDLLFWNLTESQDPAIGDERS